MNEAIWFMLVTFVCGCAAGVTLMHPHYAHHALAWCTLAGATVWAWGTR